jgi:ParB/RepB/Spo0J family partition protein
MQTGREQKLPAAEWVALSALKTWKRNPRKNKEAISAVARSIESFGFGAPIVARREDHRIIAGHTRYEAAKRLAMETVPVRFLDVTEEQANALALADNKLGEIAEWDDDQLKMILAELRSHDAELPAIAGWSDEELAKLLDEPAFLPATADDSDALDQRAQVTCPNCGHEFTKS